MSFVIALPVWLLWTLGIIAGLIVAAFAIVGAAFLWAFRKGPLI